MDLQKIKEKVILKHQLEYFKILNCYYRSDRIKKPITKLRLYKNYKKIWAGVMIL